MKSLSEQEVKQIAVSPKSMNIDFNAIHEISFKAKNISDSTLKGHVTDRHLFNKINIINSTLQEFVASDVNFYCCDIKDSVIVDSHFTNCKFDSGAHINNRITNTKFEKCSFIFNSITDTEFLNVEFIDCNFTNVVMSTCNFKNCTFRGCITSNKMVESSLFFDSMIYDTNIQVETILENFGLTISNLNASKVRVLRNGRKTLVNPESVSEYVQVPLAAIEGFILSYFYNPTLLLDGGDEVDATFNYSNWLELSKNPNRFRLLLERYHEFILYNYEKDMAPFWMVLKLHAMTEDLSLRISSENLELYRSIMGIHMSLARMVESYLRLASALTNEHLEDGKIALLVKGPIEAEYYCMFQRMGCWRSAKQ